MVVKLIEVDVVTGLRLLSVNVAVIAEELKPLAGMLSGAAKRVMAAVCPLPGMVVVVVPPVVVVVVVVVPPVVVVVVVASSPKQAVNVRTRIEMKRKIESFVYNLPFFVFISKTPFNI